MGKQIRFYVIHCTATKAGREVTGDEIRQWHLGPLDLPGKVVYMGKDYPNRAALPNERIGGVDIKKLKGRGWRKVGYPELIHLTGEKETLNHYNYDAIVDAWEITNGVAGINDTALHIVYVGGVPGDTRTPAQNKTLRGEIQKALINWPWILIAGHNQFDAKQCPSFDVREFCRSIGVPEKNIYQAPLKVAL